MELSEYVDRFSKHVGTAIEAIENAAKCYAEALREHPKDAQREFDKRYPHVTSNTWAKFRAVGNGDANPCIMLFSDKFASKIIRMPRVRQDEVLNGDSFIVFNPTTREAEKVTYCDIKPRHERILFNDNNASVRTIQEQKDYADLLASARKRTRVPYAVKGDHLEVYEACNIGREELVSICEEIGE